MIIPLNKFSPILIAAPLFVLAACAEKQEAPEDIAPEEQATAEPDNAEPDKAEPVEAEKAEAEEMATMAETAWRVLGEDGAVYTTFFDANGLYRDFKNGEALQSGSWEERDDGKLCFTPEEEDRIGECWELGKVDRDGMMKPVSDAGKTIELRQVTYMAPLDAS